MNTTQVLDISGIIETFDADETRTLIKHQLAMFEDDSCEIMSDNFKLYYTRYAALRKQRVDLDAEVFLEAEERFFHICEIFIEEICRLFNLKMDDDYLDSIHGDIPNQALPLYLFFVLNLRSNIFNVLLTFINKNRDIIAEQFESLRNKHDSITTANRALEDQTVALIVSNIYNVVDWCMENMETDVFFENMEKDYIAYEPVKHMFDENIIDGEFCQAIAKIMKNNVALKARVCFDLICKLQGFRFDF